LLLQLRAALTSLCRWWDERNAVVAIRQQMEWPMFCQLASEQATSAGAIQRLDQVPVSSRGMAASAVVVDVRHASVAARVVLMEGMERERGG
jgi:hypothetical protein